MKSNICTEIFCLDLKKRIQGISIFLLVVIDCFATQLYSQVFSLQKVFISDRDSSILIQTSKTNKVIFSKIYQRLDTVDVVIINRNNLTKSDIMWDVYQSKLLFIKFYWFINDFRCGIVSKSLEDTIKPLTIDETITFRDFIYYNPPPLSKNFGQALVSNENIISYYQPYDFIIDESGIYFIIGNTYTGKYELWYYSIKYFIQKDLISANSKIDTYPNSRDKWKKYILSDILEPLDPSKIILVKDGSNLVLFSARGNIYQLQTRGSKIKSVPLGTVNKQHQHLLIVVNKNDHKVSYLKQEDSFLLKGPYNKVPFLTLNQIMKNK
jgi:hypothetical protein